MSLLKVLHASDKITP